MAANGIISETASLLAPHNQEKLKSSNKHGSPSRKPSPPSSFLSIFQPGKEGAHDIEVRGQVAAAAAILQWWTLNVLIVLLNKYIFQVYEFTFPLTLTTIHFSLSWLGAYLYIHVFKLTPLIVVASWQDRVARVLPVSALSMANIVLGNVALRYIPVSFMQTVKSFTPAVGVILETLFFARDYDVRIWASLLPIVAGVALTTVTELSFVLTGFICALAACFANALQMIMTELLMKGKLELDSINTLYYFAPYSVGLLFLPALYLEWGPIVAWRADRPGWEAATPCVAIFVSGVIAFGLNLSVIYAVKATSAVTINVAGNLKVAVSILVSWILFQNPMTGLNVLGCAITVAGCTVYGYMTHLITLQTKKRSLDEAVRIQNLELAQAEAPPSDSTRLERKPTH
ncbi:hypothetical protein KFL_001230040 [Klebsormidium nitens]|uniref:Sugar phosphate transporter domain-containing protein n=1 Tax=Klebsormidium nitens TaxID=105231 RepID=A0A1Y1I1Y0_KLENI|nr:hypothetical protein KFL_001230040 [Klebsormidium nitens]|eukprot:GAQ82756.1 hypothetical protein KFL_001230040 [Klebsormidium nitens]